MSFVPARAYSSRLARDQRPDDGQEQAFISGCGFARATGPEFRKCGPNLPSAQLNAAGLRGGDLPSQCMQPVYCGGKPQCVSFQPRFPAPTGVRVNWSPHEYTP